MNDLLEKRFLKVLIGMEHLPEDLSDKVDKRNAWVLSRETTKIAMKYSLWLSTLSRNWYYVRNPNTGMWQGVSKTPDNSVSSMEFTDEGLFEQFLREEYGEAN